MTAQLNITTNELNNEKERNYGIDALRLLSAIMIVMLHVLSQGGILAASDNLTYRGEFMWWIQICCLSFVNVFALISGYVGLNSKHKLSNLLNLWLQVFLYTIISKIVIFSFFEKSFSIVDFCKSFFPVISSENWYFTAYFVLFFFVPVLNELMEKVDVLTIRKCLLFSVFLFMILETLCSIEVFGLRTGYSVLWLVLMYIVGAYIKKYDPLKHLVAWHCVIGFFSCTILTLLSKILIELVTLHFIGAPAYGTKFLVYTSPIMVLQAVFGVQLFSKLNIPKSLRKIVLRFAPMTFGVFIIHTTTAVYRHILYGAFSFVGDYSWTVLLVVSLTATIGIWFLCSVVDFVRICLFKLFRIYNFTNWLGVKLESLLNKLNKTKRMEK